MKKRILGLCACLLLYTSMAIADVIATGEGPNKDDALSCAMRRAVEQGSGVFISTTTTVVDFQVVEDKILSHCKGYVTSYKIVKEGKNDDRYALTISAKIDNKTLKEDIDSLSGLRRSIGNPRILVAFSKRDEGAQIFKDKDFVDEIYNGIVETLTDRQFRVVDKASSEKFARQLAETHEIDVNMNKAAAYGLKYNAEYTLLYGFSGVVREGAVNKSVQLRIKTQLIDNTRSQVVSSKVIEQTSNSQTVEQALERSAREGGKKIVNPIIEAIRKHWMDMEHNGFLYTVVIDGVDDPEAIASFTAMFEKFPLVNSAREVESGGGKSTFEATYRGRRDQLDRDVWRTAKELGWKVRKVRSEGARSAWKRQQ